MTLLLSISIILSEAVCVDLFFDTVTQRKKIIYPKLDKVMSIISIAFLGLLISNYIEMIQIKSLMIVFAYLMVNKIFYESKLWISIGASVIIFVVIISIDYFTLIIIMKIFSMQSQDVVNHKILFMFATVISKISLTIVITVFRRIFRYKTDFEFIRSRDWIILTTHSVATFITLFAIVELCAERKNIPFIVTLACIGLLFSVLFVFEFLEVSMVKERKTREVILTKTQLAIEVKSLKRLKKSYDIQRKFMHDYKNHISTIHQLIVRSSYEKALQYTKKLSNELIFNIYKIKTNNEIMDAILNQKCQEAQEKGIQFDLSSGDLSELMLSSEKLVVIISNVLDNAIEACERASCGKKITVKLVIENNTFIFSVINTVDHRVKIINNMVYTTKSDKMMHGFGLRNVAMSILDCGGDYIIDCNEKEFQFTSIINLK